MRKKLVKVARKMSTCSNGEIHAKGQPLCAGHRDSDEVPLTSSGLAEIDNMRNFKVFRICSNINISLATYQKNIRYRQFYPNI